MFIKKKSDDQDEEDYYTNFKHLKHVSSCPADLDYSDTYYLESKNSALNYNKSGFIISKHFFFQPLRRIFSLERFS